MKTLFYSIKDFEIPYLTSSNINNHEIYFETDVLSLLTVYKAKDFEAISIFINDDSSAKVIEALYKLGVKYIIIRAAGYDNVDIEFCNELGIKVANAPRYAPHAIAEHAVALILALSRKITIANNQVHKNDFTINKLVGFDLHGKTIGIIGVGKIGRVLAKIMTGFGCKVIGYDIIEDDLLSDVGNIEWVDLKALCKEADIVSIHTNLNANSKYLINDELISLMKPGVMLINTSRGACINTADVIAALESGQIGYLGIDVYENERGIFYNDFTERKIKDKMLTKLIRMPNVLVTPHQAFATKEALKNIAITTLYNIECFANGHQAKNELTEKLLNRDEISIDNINDWL